MAKEQMTLMIEEDISKEFRKKCIDNSTSYSDATEELMKEYIKRK
jgi:hypothetical protein